MYLLCNESALNVPPTLLSDRWLISIEHQLMICPIEKNGATQLLSLMWNLNNKTFLDNNVHSWAKLAIAESQKQLPNWSALPINLRRLFYTCNDIKKVVVIRDPIERTLSTYLDKCKGYNHPVTGSHCFHYRDYQARTMSFRSFVYNISRRNVGINCDKHYCLQNSFCHLKNHKNEYQIFNMSDYSFNQNFQKLMHKLNIYPDITKNEDHKTHAAWQIHKYYTKDMAKHIFKIYKKDYDIFNIPYPNFTHFNKSRNYFRN